MGNGVVVLLKDLLLNNFVFFLKGEQQVKVHGSVRVIVPGLHQIDPDLPVKHGIVQIKPLPGTKDSFPVPDVEIQISSGPDQAVHLLQNGQHLPIGDIGQTVSRAGHTVKWSRNVLFQLPEIADTQVQGVSSGGSLLPAPLQHRFAEIGAGNLHPQFQQRQGLVAAANAHIQQGMNVFPGQHGFPVPPDIPILLFRLEKIIDIRPVIKFFHCFYAPLSLWAKKSSQKRFHFCSYVLWSTGSRSKGLRIFRRRASSTKSKI